MSSLDSIAVALDGVRQGLENGRMAHAYLVVGAPRGNAKAFAESLLQLLFCESEEKPCGTCRACRRVMEHRHPDTLWIEPESKSRKISIEQVREDLIPRISQTSYEGGWKAGILVHADRMTDAAANAFLKTLEEPPGSSVLLLLSDAAQYLLPTIVSRCQRIILGSGRAADAGEWTEAVLQVLRTGRPGGGIEAMLQAGLLKRILDAVKSSVAEETREELNEEESEIDNDTRDARISARMLETRSDILRLLLLWKRDVLFRCIGMDSKYLHFPGEIEALDRQASGTDYAGALKDVRAVEGIVARLERNMPPEAVFEIGLRDGFARS